MLENINELKRQVLAEINGSLHSPVFTNYREMLGDSFLLNKKEFIIKYSIDFKSEVKNLHLIDIFLFKTFDGGEIEIELHKYDGDYEYKYNTKIASEQVQKIQDNFEASWINDNLNVLLF